MFYVWNTIVQTLFAPVTILIYLVGLLGRQPTALLLVLMVAIASTGCNQKQGTDTMQPSEQAQTTTAQQAQDGPQQTANLVTNPHGRGTFNAHGYTDQTDEGETSDGPPLNPQLEAAVLLQDGQSAVRLARGMGPDQSIVVYGGIHFGGLTSGVTGSQAQTPTGTQTPTATATGGSMVQEPKSSAAVPITVSAAPGSSAQGGSTAAAQEGSTGAQTSENQATIDYLQARIKAGEGKIAELMQAIEALKAAQNPTTQPAPADEPNPES